MITPATCRACNRQLGAINVLDATRAVSLKRLSGRRDRVEEARVADLGSVLRELDIDPCDHVPERAVLERPSCSLRRSQVVVRSEEHTSELQSRLHLVCRLLLEK